MFVVKELSISAQTLLYACAFWTVAADEELKPAEQVWLKEQFGEDGATESLQDFVSLESDAFFKVFDDSVNAIEDEERRIIYPDIETWLLSCAMSDDQKVCEEYKIIEKIKERLSLESELQRLFPAEPAPAEVPPPGEVEEEPQAPEETGLRSGPEVRMVEGHDGEITDVDISPDGRFVLSCAEDATVRLWDFEKGKELRVLEGHEMGVTCVRYCGNALRAVSGDRLGVLKMWDVDNGTSLWSFKKRKMGGISGLDTSSDGSVIVTSSDIGLICVHSPADGSITSTFGEKRHGAVNSVSVSQDGKMVLSGGDDRNIRLWNIDGSEMKVMSGHDDGIMSVSFSLDCRYAVSGSRDNTVRLWDLSTGNEERIFEGHNFTVKDVCFCSEDEYIFSGSWDHTARLWSIASGKELFKLESQNGRFSAVAFHPDGRQVIAGDSDKAIHMVRLV